MYTHEGKNLLPLNVDNNLPIVDICFKRLIVKCIPVPQMRAGNY